LISFGGGDAGEYSGYRVLYDPKDNGNCVSKCM
jgi:hypothetical protein